MFTFIVVVAIAAFIPYVAAPAIANGVKAVSTPSPEVSLDEAPQAPAAGSDAADRPMPRQRDSESAG
ncbi:hypothetical protein [Paraburkholderia strydomiana]|uniref:hypothetical protein n=1 Tax=Paraburkholderia strydomiana TaxID=1245417 RepID=UPI0038B7A177